MVNRRSIIKIGAATVAGGLVKVSDFGRNAALGQTHSAFQRAIFDERFAECRSFAAELHSTGVFSSAIRGNVAKLWYDDLREVLSSNRAPVAGLTDRAALFFLEEFAREVGMHVIFRADHIINQDGGTNGPARHTAAGPASLVAVAGNLTPEPGFGRKMAKLFQHFDASEPREAAAQKCTGPFSPENKTALVSWIIA
jgi:hypothetical protein